MNRISPQSSHSSSKLVENNLEDFMQPRSYEFTLQQIEQSFQLFPPFNSPRQPTKDDFDQTEKQKPYIEHFARLNSPISTIQAFPYGDCFAIGTINCIYIASNKLDRIIPFQENERTIFENIDVHPSTMVLACDSPARTNSVRIVSLQNNSTIMTLNKHMRKITSIFFLPSVHKIFSTALDGVLMISDLIKGTESYRFAAYENKSAITTASIKDEELISIGFDSGLVGIFDNREEEGMIQIPNAHSDYVNSIAFTPSQSQIATTSLDQMIKVWDFRNLEKPIFSQEAKGIHLSKIFFLDDSIVAGTSTTGKLIQWDASTGNLLKMNTVRQFGIFASTQQRDLDRLIVSSEDNVVSMLYY